MLGKHQRDDLSDTNDSDRSGAGSTLLTTISPARQVRLDLYIFLDAAAHGNFETKTRLANKGLSPVEGLE
jgi:hypothetical protein